jgi:cytochrome c oxidase accessory protein FixG
MATTPEVRPKPPAHAPPTAEKTWHHIRKRIHLVCFLIFVLLPFFDVMRFDIPRQRFYFAGFELWINEFAIIFFSLMFLMFLIVASAIVYGRVYCSYLCPQMIFSEWSIQVENRLRKWVNKRWIKWPASRRNRVSIALFYGVLGVASMFLAFVFTSYFVDPRDLLGRLLRLDIQTAGGITGATVTLLTFLDFTLVRVRFCTTVCPYGYLQGMLIDRNSLLVLYDDEQKECIECKKCIRVCHMGIDIRKSPYQIECVHCGECIDACEEVLARLGKDTLIRYAWGEKNRSIPVKEPWYFRLGLRDAKRVVILLVLLFYLCGLAVALSMRRPVLVQAAPVRTTLYGKLDDGRVTNQFRIKLANRSTKPVEIRLRVENLPGGEILLSENPVTLAAGEVLEQTFDIRVRPWAGAREVNRFRLVAQPANEREPDSFDMTFILPAERRGS